MANTKHPWVTVTWGITLGNGCMLELHRNIATGREDVVIKGRLVGQNITLCPAAISSVQSIIDCFERVKLHCADLDPLDTKV